MFRRARLPSCTTAPCSRRQANNSNFFLDNAGTPQLTDLGNSIQPPNFQANTVMRLGSTGKTFIAAAVLELQQMLQGILNNPNYSLLDQSFLGLLGYSPNAPITGYNPVNPQTPTDLSAYLPASAFTITVQDLLDMHSGIYDPTLPPSSELSIDTDSQSFPNIGYQNAYGNYASYAAIQFALGSPAVNLQISSGFPAPATQQQIVNYFLYQMASGNNGRPIFNPSSIGQVFNYEDINFQIAAFIVDELVQQYGLSDDYGDFLLKYVLNPIGIDEPVAPGQTEPATNALFGPAHEFQDESYQNEITYYSGDPSQNPSAINDVPNPTATTPPYNPSARVYSQYGSANVQSGQDGARWWPRRPPWPCSTTTCKP